MVIFSIFHEFVQFEGRRLLDKATKRTVILRPGSGPGGGRDGAPPVNCPAGVFTFMR